MNSEKEISYHRFLITKDLLNAYKAKMQDPKKETALDAIHNFHEQLKEHNLILTTLANLSIYLEKENIYSDKEKQKLKNPNIETDKFNSYNDMDLLFKNSFDDLLNILIQQLNPEDNDFKK